MKYLAIILLVTFLLVACSAKLSENSYNQINEKPTDTFNESNNSGINNIFAVDENDGEIIPPPAPN